MLRLVCAAILSTLAGAAHAACEGDNLIAGLPAADRATLEAAIAEHPYPKGNFWTAEKPGSTVIVAGTMHLNDPRLAPMMESLAPRVDAADLVILEATAEVEAEMQAMMAERPDLVFITEGRTLIDRLGEDDWSKLKTLMSERGVPGFMASKLQPWYVSLMLALPGCAMQDIAAGKGGLDKMIEARARDGDIPLAALDDAQTIFTLLGTDSIDEQVDMLRLTLAMDTDEDAMFSTMMDSYFAGRHRELWEFTRLFVSDMPADQAKTLFDEMEAAILDDRNRAWEPRIADLVQGRNAVLAVGAAHLSGETGVLRSLERAGYTLSPL